MRSLWVRKERFLIAMVAVMLSAAMVASLLTISFDIKERMGKELRSYGANLVVLPGEGEYIEKFDASHSSIIDSVPFLYFKSDISSKKIEFAGTDLEAAKRMNPWWHIEGTLPDQDEVMIGINAANRLGLKTDDTLRIQGNSFRVSGILDTGTSDDDRVFMHLATASKISGKSGATSVQVSVLGDIDEVSEYLESNNYKVKKIRQVAESEKVLLGKTQLLMSLVALFVLSSAFLGLMSTMITGVLERSREIGLMKALGCTDRRIASIFLTEAGIVGTAGGILGFLAGLALAQFIGIRIFNIPVSVKPEVFLLTILTSILIAFIGSILPVRRALSIDPVITLRGE